MKRIWVVIVNILIMASMLVFIFIYSSNENKDEFNRQVEHYKSSTATMEHVTENYLEGEQRICDVWSHYINDRNSEVDSSKNMTIEDAKSFIFTSYVLATASAHIIYKDTLTGLSTRAHIIDADNYEVSYANSGLFGDMSWIDSKIGKSINISRAYNNPINGETSIAFCNFIKLADGGVLKDAILLRVLPITELMDKWVFPQDEFKKAELSVIDSNGSFIIQGDAFDNYSNFFEFYRAYNSISPDGYNNLIKEVTTNEFGGSFFMNNSDKENCILAYTPFDASGGWILLSIMHSQYLDVTKQNWNLIGVVSGWLAALFIFDLVVMLYFNKRLKATAKEADVANKAKTKFLSTMSHDIRTPMNAIIGLTTISEKNIDDKKSVKENLRKIELASNHLLTLINDILDISKVESGKLNLVPQTFSLVETVENLTNISQPMIKEKNIDFNFRVSKIEKEYLYADQLRLNQIYINILSNAIKYTEPGGKVSVDMKEENSEKPGCVRITYIVSDTGIGMTKEFMDNMYQAFSRQTDSRVNSIQGTGLGLAITKQMVDLMQGTIECESESGKGTTFTVTLDIPVSEKQLEEMKSEPMDVLIADDDEVLLETGADTLKSLGLNVDKARSGVEAIEMVKARHKEKKDYRIVIIDLKMPEIDGIETIKKIHSEVDTNTPVLLISAYDYSDVEKKAKDAGANGFLSKPLFRSTLYNKINEILGTESKTIEPENDYSDLEGLNILVTEDNDINYEIISTLLEMYGITTDRAENGRICLDKMKEVEKDKYLLIFMDIQMPEMNGLDATRAIRKLEDPYASNIPIIAMTSDAFSENVAECLNAGMNGHIAKPIDIKLVLKEIRRIKEESKL